MKKSFAIFLIVIICYSFKTTVDSLFVVPKNFPNPVYNFKDNELNKEKIALGKILFNDPLLSKDNTISCSSCHLSYTAFAHTDHALSHGIENRIGIRNAPALFNLAWNKTFMWDGAIHHLDVQALAPITNNLEMDETLENVVSKLQSSKRYTSLFSKAFGDSVVTGERTLKAISQFLVTLVSANSKYDKVMRKEDNTSFNDDELQGYNIFKAMCSSCHQEPLFTNHQFENNGLLPDTSLNDIGRMKITSNAEDSLKFKVPTLRNCEVTYPYMHDGRFNNLQMVLFHYSNQIHTTTTLSPLLKNKIQLSELDKNCLIAFLKTLTDEDFLRDARYR